MEQFDKIWGIIAAVIPMAMGIATLIVNATETPKDNEIVGKIALVIGRIFSFSTFKDANGKANLSLPVLQSARPKSEK